MTCAKLWYFYAYNTRHFNERSQNHAIVLEKQTFERKIWMWAKRSEEAISCGGAGTVGDLLKLVEELWGHKSIEPWTQQRPPALNWSLGTLCPRGVERQPRSHFYASRAQTWREGFDLDPICFDTMGKHCAPCLSLRGRTLRICLVGLPNFNSGRQLVQLRQCARTTNTGLPTRTRGDLARH